MMTLLSTLMHIENVRSVESLVGLRPWLIPISKPFGFFSNFQLAISTALDSAKMVISVHNTIFFVFDRNLLPCLRPRPLEFTLL